MQGSAVAPLQGADGQGQGAEIGRQRPTPAAAQPRPDGPLDAALGFAQTALVSLDDACAQHSSVSQKAADLQRVCREVVGDGAALSRSLGAVQGALAPYDTLDQAALAFKLMPMCHPPPWTPPFLWRCDASAAGAGAKLAEAAAAVATVSHHAQAAQYGALAARLLEAARQSLLEAAGSALGQACEAAAAAATRTPHPTAAACAERFQEALAAAGAQGTWGALRTLSALPPFAATWDSAVALYTSRRLGCLEATLPGAVAVEVPPPSSEGEGGASTTPAAVCAALASHVRLAGVVARREAGLFAQCVRGGSAGGGHHAAEQSELEALLSESAMLVLAPAAALLPRLTTLQALGDAAGAVADELSALAPEGDRSAPGAATAASLAACVAQGAQDVLLGSLQDRLLFAVQRDVTDVLGGWAPDTAPSAHTAYPARHIAHHICCAAGRAKVDPRPLLARHGVTVPAWAGVASWDTPPPPLPASHAWFPPLADALLALSSLYRALTRPAFGGVARDILQAALAALESARSHIARQGGPLHGWLFAVRQLLVLREQLAPFDVTLVSTARHLDLPSSPSAVLRHILQALPGLLRWGADNPLLALLAGQGLPGIITTTVDGRADLERALKGACEQFIAAAAGEVGGWVVKGAPPPPGDVVDALDAWVTQVAADLTHLRRVMATYLGAAVTHRILFTPVVTALSAAVGRIPSQLTGDAPPTLAPAMRRATTRLQGAAAAHDDAAFDPAQLAFWEEGGGEAAGSTPPPPAPPTPAQPPHTAHASAPA